MSTTENDPLENDPLMESDFDPLSSGIQEDTIKRRRAVYIKFEKNQRENNGKSLKDLVLCKDDLEKAICQFFESRRIVDQDGVVKLPKRTTCDVFKSHLKAMILESSGGALDLSNRSLFPNFHRFYRGIQCFLMFRFLTSRLFMNGFSCFDAKKAGFQLQFFMF